MKLLYEIVELGPDMWPTVIGKLGTVYAESPKEAKEIAADYYNNPDIAKTGFYEARLPKATINLENKKEYWDSKVSDAKYTLRKAGLL